MKSCNYVAVAITSLFLIKPVFAIADHHEVKHYKTQNVHAVDSGGKVVLVSNEQVSTFNKGQTIPVNSQSYIENDVSDVLAPVAP